MVRLTQWHALVAGLWAALGSGFAYSFSTFSTALQEQYGLSTADVETVGIATTAVGFVTFSAGLLADCLGPTAAILLGGLLNAVSWFVYGAIAVWRIPIREPSAVFTTIGVLATYGAACGTGALFAILLRNFEPHEGRSTAIGIAKSWGGMASGFTAAVFIGFFPSADSDPERLKYLFFLSGSATLFILVSLPFLWVREGRDVAGRAAGDGLCLPWRWRFRYLTTVTVALIAITVLVAALTRAVPQQVKVLFSLVLLALGLSPWLLLLPGRSATAVPGSEALVLELAMPEGLQRPASPWECGPLEMVRRADAWLLWLCIFALQAGGLVLNTNLGLITQSRDGPSVSGLSANAMFSAAQSLGRLTAGPLSDVAVQKRLTRPCYFVVLTVCMASGYILLCLRGPSPFYAGVMLSGYAFGSQYPVMILTIAELFGARRIASNYMVYDGMPGAFASLLVAKYFTHWAYTRSGGGDGGCHGDGCFALAYEFVIALQLAAAACATLLAVRAAPVYRCSVWAPPRETAKPEAEAAAAAAPGS